MCFQQFLTPDRLVEHVRGCICAVASAKATCQELPAHDEEYYSVSCTGCRSHKKTDSQNMFLSLTNEGRILIQGSTTHIQALKEEASKFTQYNMQTTLISILLRSLPPHKNKVLHVKRSDTPSAPPRTSTLYGRRDTMMSASTMSMWNDLRCQPD